MNLEGNSNSHAVPPSSPSTVHPLLVDKMIWRYACQIHREKVKEISERYQVKLQEVATPLLDQLTARVEIVYDGYSTPGYNCGALFRACIKEVDSLIRQIQSVTIRMQGQLPYSILSLETPLDEIVDQINKRHVDTLLLVQENMRYVILGEKKETVKAENDFLEILRLRKIWISPGRNSPRIPKIVVNKNK